jgi:cytochrome b561
MLFVCIVYAMVFILWTEATLYPGSFFERYLRALGVTLGIALAVLLAVRVGQNFRRQKKTSRDTQHKA